jgi:hypothetical protein
LKARVPELGSDTRLVISNRLDPSREFDRQKAFGGTWGGKYLANQERATSVVRFFEPGVSSMIDAVHNAGPNDVE